MYSYNDMLKRSKTKHSSPTCVLEQPSQAGQLSGDQGPHWQCTGSDTDLMDLTALIQEQAKCQTKWRWLISQKWLFAMTFNQLVSSQFSSRSQGCIRVTTGVVHHVYYEYVTKHSNSFIKIIIKKKNMLDLSWNHSCSCETYFQFYFQFDILLWCYIMQLYNAFLSVSSVSKNFSRPLFMYTVCCILTLNL